ncbi:MAG: hypothetical protein IT572_01860 [Deltaproteobacteria bacterium]|nr:hypothetical protein [Deltaproteobacteria bacterium]
MKIGLRLLRLVGVRGRQVGRAPIIFFVDGDAGLMVGAWGYRGLTLPATDGTSHRRATIEDSVQRGAALTGASDQRSEQSQK